MTKQQTIDEKQARIVELIGEVDRLGNENFELKEQLSAAEGTLFLIRLVTKQEEDEL